MNEISWRKASGSPDHRDAFESRLIHPAGKEHRSGVRLRPATHYARSPICDANVNEPSAYSTYDVHSAMAAEGERINWKARMEWLLRNPATADVHFNVGSDETGKERIGANKDLLAAGSEVLYGMFYGDFGSPDEVDMPDGSPAAFKVLLKYLYMDELALDPSSAMDVYYLAKKYMINGLLAKTVEYLQEKINAHNVLHFLPHVAVVDEIAPRCWKIVDNEAKDVIETHEFLAVTPEILTSIISRDQLFVQETVIYKRVIEWAKAELQRKETDVTPQAVRALLGNAFYEIRFTEMKLEEFGSAPAKEEYLTDQEKLAIFMHFSTKETPALFKVGPRAADPFMGLFNEELPEEHHCHVCGTPAIESRREHPIAFGTAAVALRSLSPFAGTSRGTLGRSRHNRAPVSVDRNRRSTGDYTCDICSASNRVRSLAVAEHNCRSCATAAHRCNECSAFNTYHEGHLYCRYCSGDLFGCDCGYVNSQIASFDQCQACSSPIAF